MPPRRIVRIGFERIGIEIIEEGGEHGDFFDGSRGDVPDPQAATKKGEEIVFRAYLEPKFAGDGDIEATGITGSTSAEVMAQAAEIYPRRTILVTTQDLADPYKYT